MITNSSASEDLTVFAQAFLTRRQRTASMANKPSQSHVVENAVFLIASMVPMNQTLCYE
jgi:hypothetical protein